MPRKVNYGVDYEENFYDYEDYNYDYDDGYEYSETNGRAPETNTKQKLVRVGIWRCSICTYDNRESMNVCDVCGNPKQEPVKVGLWCCPICTFDNEATTNLCDMCGVMHNPLIKGYGGGKASAATSDKIVQSHILSSKKEIAGEEERTSSSTSTAKVRRDDTKDRGSSIGTRGNHGVMSSMSNMSVSSNPCNA